MNGVRSNGLARARSRARAFDRSLHVVRLLLVIGRAAVLIHVAARMREGESRRVLFHDGCTLAV